MSQLKETLQRCFGYRCNMKRQCKRFLAIETDKPGLYAYSDRMSTYPDNDVLTECDSYLEVEK